MEAKVIDRIENKEIDKKYKIFKWLIIVTIPLGIGHGFVIFSETFGGFLDLFFVLILMLMFVQQLMYFKKRKGQFIEWKETGIEYKVIEKTPIFLEYSEIENITINLEDVVFKLKDGSEKILSIKDYSNYNDKKKIKENFEAVRKNFS